MKESEVGYLNLHPKPRDFKIALVLLYNDLHIVYNGFGQRIGAKAFPETKHHMVFYSEDEIVVADNDSWITRYTAGFTEKSSRIAEKIDRYFIDSVYKRSFTVFGITFFKHNEEAIYSFFEMIISHWDQLENAGLSQKYQKYNVLDMMAICEILHLEIMTSEIIKRFTQRIEKELLREFSKDTSVKFLSVSDLLYDEVHSWPIIKKMNSIIWN